MTRPVDHRRCTVSVSIKQSACNHSPTVYRANNLTSLGWLPDMFVFKTKWLAYVLCIKNTNTFKCNRIIVINIVTPAIFNRSHPHFSCFSSRSLWKKKRIQSILATTSVSHWHFSAPQASVWVHVMTGSVVSGSQQRRKKNLPQRSAGVITTVVPIENGLSHPCRVLLS